MTSLPVSDFEKLRLELDRARAHAEYLRAESVKLEEERDTLRDRVDYLEDMLRQALCGRPTTMPKRRRRTA